MSAELEDLKATIHEGYDLIRRLTQEDTHKLVNKLEDSHLLMLEHCWELAGVADVLRDALRLPSELLVVKGGVR